MTEVRSAFACLEDAVTDESFPDVDLALRRGRHIDRDDGAWFVFLNDAQALLEPFYRRFGCELIYRGDGYYYLLPTGDRLGRRHLSSGEMLVGQALTLLYLDPATVQHGGLVTREELLAHLAGVMGADSLVRTLNPKRRKYDERVAQETVRNKVSEALRRLATLGFIDLVDEQVRLRPALMRFAEPVRGVAAPEAALERLVAEGELVLTEGTAQGAADEDEAVDQELDDLAAEEAEAPDEPDVSDASAEPASQASAESTSDASAESAGEAPDGEEAPA